MAKITKDTKILWCKGGWLPQHYMDVMPQRMKELGFNIDYREDWTTPDDVLSEYINDYDVIFCPGPSVYKHFLNKMNVNTKTPPILAHVWDYAIFRQWDGYSIGFVEREFMELKKKAWKICCLSNYTQSLLKTYADIDADVQLSYFDNEMVDSVPSQEKEDQIIVSCVHRPDKNIQLVLQGMSYLKKKPTLVLTGSGGGLIEELYQKMIKAFELPVIEKFGLSYEDTIKEIKKSKLLIHPSAFEGFGLPPKEAIWGGTVALISDIPVMRETHGERNMAYISVTDPLSVWHYLVLLERGETLYNMEEAKENLRRYTIQAQAQKFADYLYGLEY